MIGEQFNYLTINSLPFKKQMKNRTRKFVTVECVCGIIKDVNFEDLKSLKVKSCGCKTGQMISEGLKTHSMTDSSFYEIWAGMKKRCNNINFFAYKDYGGRGISYQDSWESFEVFYSEMYDTYSQGLELDREDNNGNYTKDNCRWVDRGINCHNRRKRKGSKCSSIGVSLKDGKYRASLQFEGKVVFRQIYLTEQQAAQAYDDASEDYYGDRPNKTIKGDIPI